MILFQRKIPLFILIPILVGVLYLCLLSLDILIRPITTENETALALIYAATHNKELPPISFYHDGCTAFPDRFFGYNLYEPCFRHDVTSWLGGTEAERIASNKELRRSVESMRGLGVVIGPVIYVAVQYFGDNWVSRFLGSNWGYGWND